MAQQNRHTGRRPSRATSTALWPGFPDYGGGNPLDNLRRGGQAVIQDLVSRPDERAKHLRQGDLKEMALDALLGPVYDVRHLLDAGNGGALRGAGPAIALPAPTRRATVGPKKPAQRGFVQQVRDEAGRLGRDFMEPVDEAVRTLAYDKGRVARAQAEHKAHPGFGSQARLAWEEFSEKPRQGMDRLNVLLSLIDGAGSAAGGAATDMGFRPTVEVKQGKRTRGQVYYYLADDPTKTPISPEGVFEVTSINGKMGTVTHGGYRKRITDADLARRYNKNRGRIAANIGTMFIPGGQGEGAAKITAAILQRANMLRELKIPASLATAGPKIVQDAVSLLGRAPVAGRWARADVAKALASAEEAFYKIAGRRPSHEEQMALSNMLRAGAKSLGKDLRPLLSRVEDIVPYRAFRTAMDEGLSSNRELLKAGKAVMKKAKKEDGWQRLRDEVFSGLGQVGEGKGFTASRFVEDVGGIRPKNLRLVLGRKKREALETLRPVMEHLSGLDNVVAPLAKGEKTKGFYAAAATMLKGFKPVAEALGGAGIVSKVLTSPRAFEVIEVGLKAGWTPDRIAKAAYTAYQADRLEEKLAPSPKHQP